jgi:protein-S-isoprenylcysteine O-methyltransferase Ste14
LTGLAFALAVLLLMYRTMKLFNNKAGGGTPAPWDTINNQIVEGPYRYVRDPMLIGVNLFLMAEAILMQSLPVFG